MDELVETAREARSNAYAPYSGYTVGAALEATDGTIYTGCNVEVVNFSNSLHAEAVALSGAIADGRHSFERIAVSTSAQDGATPCGSCRQTLREFCGPDLLVICDGGDVHHEFTLGALLPASFAPTSIGAEDE